MPGRRCRRGWWPSRWPTRQDARCRPGRRPGARPSEAGGTVPGVGRVIVGASGSPGSLQALRYGEVVARAHDAVLVPVLAWQPPGGDRCADRYLRQEWHDLSCQRLRSALAAVWGEVPADPRVQPRVERGPAGWVLVTIACCPEDLLV